MKGKMKIALGQMHITDNIEDNFTKSLEFIREASENNADLICFSELQLTPFFPQYPKKDASKYLIPYTNSKYIEGIQKACAKYEIYASPNVYIQENNANYDMSFLINKEGEIIGKQKMVNVANHKHFYEKDYYCPGEDGFNVFETEFGKIGIVVCYDRHFSQSIYQEALKGANLILIPTANICGEDLTMFEWEIKVQAFQNNVNIAMCNRVGKEDKIEFCGKSLICDYTGQTIAIGENKEEIIYADINMEKSKNKTYLEI